MWEEFTVMNGKLMQPVPLLGLTKSHSMQDQASWPPSSELTTCILAFNRRVNSEKNPPPVHSRLFKEDGPLLQCCGSGMFIPDPDFFPSRIPDPKKHGEVNKFFLKSVFSPFCSFPLLLKQILTHNCCIFCIFSFFNPRNKLALSSQK